MSNKTAWLIGSYPSLPAQTVTITPDGGGETIAAGNYYLYHGTDALSLLYKFAQAMTAAGLSSVSCRLLESGLVKISATETFAVAWAGGASDLLPALLGFTGGNLSGATNYTAPDYSTHFWSPGWPETPDDMAPTGVTGWEQSDTVIGSAADGTMEFASNNTRIHNQFSFASVVKARTHTADEDPGEYYKFWQEVLVKGRRWNLYTGQTEDRAGSSDASYVTKLGPYKLRAQGPPLRPGHRRERNNNDNLWSVSIPAQLVAEYS